MPRSVALVFAAFAGLAYHLLGKFVPSINPELSRYSVDALTQDFHFSWDRAARDFGYAPLVSREEAFRRTLEWAKEARL